MAVAEDDGPAGGDLGGGDADRVDASAADVAADAAPGDRLQHEALEGLGVEQAVEAIRTLAFAQAGKTWSSFDTFSPFKLYRSAGVGLRLFLPMFGPMGLDYGWRLDDVPGQPNMARSQFHFTIGIDLGEL